MKYLVTSEEMKQYDNNTIEKIGIPGMVLMERAALSVLAIIEKKYRQEKPEHIKVLILAGMGNNGGDGLALSRLLSERGYQVSVWCVGEQSKASEQWKLQRKILENYPVHMENKAPTEEYTIYVDALFGVGLSREVGGEYRDAIRYFNHRNGYKIALDIPSGLDAGSGEVLGCAVKADTTITFGFCKRGLVLYPGCEYAGEVITADVGITAQSFLGAEPSMYYYDENVEEVLPERTQYGNKGTFGKVLVVAGSVNMAGAAVLAAMGAYRAGAGMVKVITPAENREIIQIKIPEALLGTLDDLEESLQWADVAVIGPGIGQGERALECVETVIGSSLPLVIDADGLNLLARMPALKEKIRSRKEGVILTPHVGELSRLTGEDIGTLKSNLSHYGAELATDLNVILVAKDAQTFVCAKERPICVNLRGNSGMATAGSGDVLAGVIGGLLAQGMEPHKAAAVGVYVHACAGEAAAAKLGEHSVMAGDIAAYIGSTGNRERQEVDCDESFTGTNQYL